MKNRTTHLVAAILFFLCAGAWAASLCMAFANGTEVWVCILDALCLLCSFTAAILQLVQYFRADENTP